MLRWCLQAADVALWGGGGGRCLNIKSQTASLHTASSSEQTARRHGNAAPGGRSLSVVLKGSWAEEAEGEGCRRCECCRQRKSAVSTRPDDLVAQIMPKYIPLHSNISPSWFIKLYNYNKHIFFNGAINGRAWVVVKETHVRYFS